MSYVLPGATWGREKSDDLSHLMPDSAAITRLRKRADEKSVGERTGVGKIARGCALENKARCGIRSTCLLSQPRGVGGLN